MTKTESQGPESALDLALDVVPCGNEPYSPLMCSTGFERPTGRSAVRAGRRETAGWELTRDPVYDG